MPRPQRCRRICALPEYTRFSPEGGAGETVILSLDEYETLRMMDYAGCTHEQCAAVMQVSRTTVTEIYAEARRKLATALVEGRTLVIDGGSVRLCDGTAGCGVGVCCQEAADRAAPFAEKRRITMKIAATYSEGEIFQHFGHTEQFKLYDIEDGRVVRSQVVNAGGAGHGALAGFLRDQGVDALICGGIGGGAQAALAQAGIALYAGVTGGADEAAAALAAGNLAFDPDARCEHHGEHHGAGHDCGHHDGEACGAHGCGGHNQ